MKHILNKLIAHQTLEKAEAKQILVNIAKGEYNTSQIASFLTVYMMRSINISELEGFRDALLELCIRVDLDDYNPIDLCGTGGDGKDTFNVSTLASFVCAGAGIKVAKHGNYGVSSTCGSSNVLEYLGINFSDDQAVLRQHIEETGICVLHAPKFHPALKNVGPIRKELAVKTFFNMLGPMVNPCFPKRQLVGVFSLELARLYGYLYQNTGKQFAIVHALDVYDEISLTCDTKIITSEGEKMLTPADFGVSMLKQEQIRGGQTIKESANIFMKVLNTEGSEAQNNVVCANAGMAIHCVYPHISPSEGFQLAKESLLSKKALNTFTKLQGLCK